MLKNMTLPFKVNSYSCKRTESHYGPAIFTAMAMLGWNSVVSRLSFRSLFRIVATSRVCRMCVLSVAISMCSLLETPRSFTQLSDSRTAIDLRASLGVYETSHFISLSCRYVAAFRSRSYSVLWSR